MSDVSPMKIALIYSIFALLRKNSRVKRTKGQNCAFFAPFFALSAQKYLHKRRFGSRER